MIANLQEQLGHPWTRTVDLTHLWDQAHFLEGTGSLVLDRDRRIAYAGLFADHGPCVARVCEGERLSHPCLPHGGCERLPIYHTNVLFSLGPHYAVLCADALPDPQERAMLLHALEQSGREVILIDHSQMADFAGNQMFLEGKHGNPVIVLSRRALASLDGEQRRRLERHASLLAPALDTIEVHGGGSARCMLAEVHLP
ncbi:MAG: arginine deiminase-related protein [Planctomycetota bacterium]